jgi:hypothetical protein
MMVRQGDVLIVAIEGELPRGAREVKREAGSVILAHGEASGHAHRIRSRHAELYEHGEHRYLRIRAPVDLSHEEHGAIPLEPGLYRVVRQREYQPKKNPRWVFD